MLIKAIFFGQNGHLTVVVLKGYTALFATLSAMRIKSKYQVLPYTYDICTGAL